MAKATENKGATGEIRSVRPQDQAIAGATPTAKVGTEEQLELQGDRSGPGEIAVERPLRQDNPTRNPPEILVGREHIGAHTPQDRPGAINRTRLDKKPKTPGMKARAAVISAANPERGGVFRLVVGRHAQDGETYEAGDKIISDIDLESKHGKEKFQRIHDEDD